MKTAEAVFERQQPGMECLHGALSPLLPSARATRGLYLALGPQGAEAWLQDALAPALATGLRLFWIDASGSFDLRRLCRSLARRGVDPAPALSRLTLARPSSPAELADVVAEAAARAAGEAIVLGDPFALLYDEGHSHAEAEDGFEALAGALRSPRSLTLGLACARPAPRGREGWLSCLLARSLAAAYWTNEGGRPRLEAGEAAELRAALREREREPILGPGLAPAYAF